MDRRAFISSIAGGLLVTPLVAEGQPAGRPPRIAYVAGAPPPSGSRVWAAFIQGLRQLGWVEGQNIVIEQRFTAGDRSAALTDREVLRIP